MMRRLLSGMVLIIGVAALSGASFAPTIAAAVDQDGCSLAQVEVSPETVIEPCS
jgi:hypothetical protein